LTGNLIRSAESIAEIVKRACERRDMMILVTPYIRFESAFLKLEGGEIQASATMSREDAMYGLRSSDLRMRFPHSLSFLEAPTSLLGFGMFEGRSTLRLALPAALQEQDHRSAYRVDRVGGRVPVTFSTPKFDLVTGTLVDISTTGARVFSTRDFSPGELQPGQKMAVTIQLTETIRINTSVRLRHFQGRTFGVEFHPQLDERTLHPLSRWVFEKREEDLERTARREVDPAPSTEPGRVAVAARGLLLVSGDAALETALQDLLGGLQPLRRIAPTMSAVKEVVNLRPALVLYHVPSLSLDDRRRLKTMVETFQGKVPFLLLGTGVEGGSLLELGSELKATVSIVFNPERGTFFQRLVQGVLRRTYEGGEAPMAPVEPEGR
jgi:hypothetical protein